MPSDIDPIIETPRLRLNRLTNTDLGSRDLQWFHEHWSDETTTGWSLHGRCKTIEESREWMIQHMTVFESITYSVHVKDTEDHVGNISLRVQKTGPDLPPPPPPSTQGIASGTAKPLNLRVIGYAFFQRAWGKGYATEANAGLIEAYRKYRAQFEDETSYIEAGVDEDNPESIKVLLKLGFEKVGWKEGSEKVFLNGKWRDPGYWIYGMYV